MKDSVIALPGGKGGLVGVVEGEGIGGVKEREGAEERGKEGKGGKGGIPRRIKEQAMVVLTTVVAAVDMEEEHILGRVLEMKWFGIEADGNGDNARHAWEDNA